MSPPWLPIFAFVRVAPGQSFITCHFVISLGFEGDCQACLNLLEWGGGLWVSCRNLHHTDLLRCVWLQALRGQVLGPSQDTCVRWGLAPIAYKAVWLRSVGGGVWTEGWLGVNARAEMAQWESLDLVKGKVSFIWILPWVLPLCVSLCLSLSGSQLFGRCLVSFCVFIFLSSLYPANCWDLQPTFIDALSRGQIWSTNKMLWRL